MANKAILYGLTFGVRVTLGDGTVMDHEIEDASCPSNALSRAISWAGSRSNLVKKLEVLYCREMNPQPLEPHAKSRSPSS